MDTLLSGLVQTVWISAVAIVLGVFIGIACAVARSADSRVLRAASTFYVESMRNTPFIVQLFIVFFGLPSMGVQITAVQAGLIALTLNLGAYSTEIIRAGIEATHRSQIEAGMALGLTRRDILLHVVLLPALEKVWPALSSQFVLTMLASSILSQISVEELTSAGALIDSRTYRSMEVYILLAGFYLALTMVFRLAFDLAGRVLFPRRRAVGARR
ncbi:amino acid ABC transporter permease [Bosea sp. TWI1241]|uniref:amino acid ABC transporter permease n=1 Tax=Bosea sp. TWI1241 TaxID=3148904 RepID=UPI0032083012